MLEIFGYCRISDKSQHEDRQIIAMNELKIPPSNVFTDKQSGADFNRPAYKALVEKLKAGDLLWIKDLSRLGRNYEEIQNQWRILTKEKGVDIAIIDTPLVDTRLHKDLMGTFISDLFLQILSFISANELATIRQRQREGIAAAKARGVKFGRPVKPLPNNFGEFVNQWDAKQSSKDEILKKCRISQATFYRRRTQHRTTQGKTI